MAYLCISPLHATFRCPQPDSSTTVSKAVPWLSHGLSPLTDRAAYAPFNPVIPDNACTLRITAAAGTELAGAIRKVPSAFLKRKGSFPNKSSLQPVGLSSCTRDGWIRLAPIVQYSLLLPPVGVGSVSQYPCGGPRSHAPYPS